MNTIDPGTVADAAALTLDLTPLPAEQVVSGSPMTGAAPLGEIGGVDMGVWEHTPGTSTDVEADEVFVVLSGSATVAFTDPVSDPIELRPGSVARLAAGMHTTWTVHETLRKVYLTP